MIRLACAATIAVLALCFVGCDDDDDDPGGTGGTTSGTGGTTSGTGGSGGTTSGTGGSGGNVGGSGGTGGSGGDGGSTANHNCAVTVDNATLCVQDATGAPGTTVSVNVWALMPAGCDGVDAIAGPIAADDSYFMVTNPVTNTEAQAGQNHCITQMTEVGYDSIHIWTWSQGMEGNTSCPNPFPAGIATTLEIAIDANTPPGNYDFTTTGDVYGWDSINQAAHMSQPCGPGATAISGVLTVQ